MENIDRPQTELVSLNLCLAHTEKNIIALTLTRNHFDVVHHNRVFQPLIELCLIFKTARELGRKRIFHEVIHVDEIIVLIIQNKAVTHLIRKIVKRPVAKLSSRIIVYKIQAGYIDYINDQSDDPHRPPL